MKTIIHLLLSAVVVVIGAYLIPGIHIAGFFDAIIVAIVISLINTFLRPILVIFTIPITIFTLGLFLLVIDAVVILLAGNLISGFQVAGFWPALFFSLVLSLLTWLLTGKRNG
jgi:putative membrane protein